MVCFCYENYYFFFCDFITRYLKIITAFKVVVDAFYVKDGKNCLRTDNNLYTGTHRISIDLISICYAS